MSALEKILEYSQPMKHQSAAIAHLYISLDPTGGSKFGKKISNLFSTHPPIPDKIKALVG